MSWDEPRVHRDGSIRWFLRDRDKSGKKYTYNNNAGPHVKIRKRLMADHDRQIAAGENPEVQALMGTIDDALESWIRDEPKQPKTVLEYRDSVQKLKDHAKASRLNELSADMIAAWRYDMETGKLMYTRNDGKTYHQYSKWTIWRLVRNIKAFLRFCVRREWVSHKLPATIRQGVPKSTKRFLTREEAARLIKACRTEKYMSFSGRKRTDPDIERAVIQISCEKASLGYSSIPAHLVKAGITLSKGGVRSIWTRYGLLKEADRLLYRNRKFVPLIKESQWRRGRSPNNELRRIMLFGLYTGMRVGEVLIARWEQFHPEEVLRRLPSGQILSEIVYVLYIPIAKGDKERSVAIHPTMARILGIRKRIGKQTGIIFPQWTKSSLSQARIRAVRRAGLGRVRFHDLRHSFVRNYLKSGAGSLPELQDQTGHSDLGSLQVYAHFSSNDAAANIRKYRIQ